MATENKTPPTAAPGQKLRVRAKQFITVDGVAFQKDQEGEITPKQYAALAYAFTRLTALLLFLCAVFTVQAQTYRVTAVGTNLAVSGVGTNYSATAITNVLHTAATTTTMLGGTNAVTKYEEVALQLAATGMETGTTSNVVVTISRSLDGVTFETYPTWTWAVPLNSTTQVVALTNLDRTILGSYGYWKFKSISTTSLADVTNVWVRIATKPVRYGP